MRMNNQRQAVLEYLKEGKVLTREIGMNQLGMWNVITRIHELRQIGYPIKTTWIPSLNRYGEATHYAEYTLEEGAAEEVEKQMELDL